MGWSACLAECEFRRIIGTRMEDDAKAKQPMLRLRGRNREERDEL